MPRRAFTVVAALVLLAGCNGVISGEPTFNTNILLSPDAEQVMEAASPPPSGPVLQRPAVCGPDHAYAPTATQADRNACIETLIAMIDARYAEYKRSFLQLVDNSTLGADLAAGGLGIAGSLVPAKTTKSILAGVSGAIGGAKTAIDSDILYNSSITIIITQMDADRSAEYSTILSRMGLNIPTQPAVPVPPPAAPAAAQAALATVPAANHVPQMSAPAAPPVDQGNMTPYSMYDASLDLQAYFQAGTFTHALLSLQNKTGSQNAKCKQQVTSQKNGTPAPQGDTSNPCSAP